MADTDLPATGKSQSITLLVAGVLRRVSDQVTSFSAKPMITEISTKNLGTSGSRIDTEFDGWEGSIEVADSNGEAEGVIDAMESASRLRLPMSLVIVETTHYADFSQKRHTYSECKVTGFDSSGSRGQARKVTISWKTGSQRITT